MVELIHKFLNLTAPAFTFFSLVIVYPPFVFFKFCQSLLSYVFSENIAEKVVLVTGASSGIGEHLAYEYASRGACLAPVARRKDRLREVVGQARDIGSPDVLMIIGDVSKVEGRERIVDETMDHFGRLDHLVNNAGISSVSMFEEITNTTAFRALIDISFWGSVYATRFAVPHLRNTRGKIVVLSSSAAWLPIPGMGIYNSSKAAFFTMFEALRVELGSDVNITIVTPGFIGSELTYGKLLDQEGKLIFDPDLREVQISAVPVRSVGACAKAIVNSVLRGQRYLTDPPWFKVTNLSTVLSPELLEWGFRLFYLTRPGASATEAPSKKIVDLTGDKNVLYPSTIQASQDQNKTD